jgi:SOS-response transcriptional repressor LexA
MERQGTNPTRLAREMQARGRTDSNVQPNLSKWLRNPAHDLDPKRTAAPLAEHLSFDMQALYSNSVAEAEAQRLGLSGAPQDSGGVDTQGKPFQNVESVGLERFRRVPLIGWVQAGMLTEFSDPFPVGIADDYELVDIEYGRRTVALRIKNDSMEPDFKEGDIIIVDPDLAPRPGDFVVAKNHVEEATFKKYRPRGTAPDGSMVFELAPLNDDYPTLRSDVDHLRIVGVMIEHRRRMRR